MEGRETRRTRRTNYCRWKYRRHGNLCWLICGGQVRQVHDPIQTDTALNNLLVPGAPLAASRHRRELTRENSKGQKAASTLKTSCPILGTSLDNARMPQSRTLPIRAQPRKAPRLRRATTARRRRRRRAPSPSPTGCTTPASGSGAGGTGGARARGPTARPTPGSGSPARRTGRAASPFPTADGIRGSTWRGCGMGGAGCSMRAARCTRGSSTLGRSMGRGRGGRPATRPAPTCTSASSTSAKLRPGPTRIAIDSEWQ